jgi:hypothetical protein
MTKSQPNICKDCNKKWYRLEDGQLINHNCCPHENTVELEDDNGNKAKGCKDCGKLMVA